jgi:hypothetical protein
MVSRYASLRFSLCGRAERGDSLELDFHLTITGFETVDLDLLIQGESKVEDAVDEIPEPLPPVTQIGDLWMLGKHRLLCADVMAQASYDTLLGDDKAQMFVVRMI